MKKTMLYGAAAAGTLAVAGAITPLAAAPGAKLAPDVQSNVTNAQVYFEFGPRYYHRRHYHNPYYYYGPPPYYYGPRYRYYHW